MELTDEEANFVKITKVVLEIVPKYLRECFKQQWNKKYPSHQWQSNKVSGNFLFGELGCGIKSNKSREVYVNKLREGNEQQWDTTTLVFAMVQSGLSLIDGCRPKNDRISPLRISEEIEIVRDVRNSVFAHASTMSCSNEDFACIIARIRCVARNIFIQGAEKEIENVENSPLETQMTTHLKLQLNLEKSRNREFNELACDVEGMFS